MTSKIKVDNINKVSDDSNIISKCGSAVSVGASGNTVTVTGNDIRSDSYKAADGGVIASQSGTTITLGASGDTISLASGASQSGFGRTGTVDWQTGSIKTATFTAASGEGYFCNTTGGAFTVNLPAGSAGAIVSIQDYNNTFDSNALSVDPNGSEKINGGSAGAPVELSTEGQGVTFVYIDSTVGWRSVQDNLYATTGSAFLTATGGTITTSGNCKIHTFTGPGTFTVSGVGSATNNVASYLVVAGGGGGGRRNNFDAGGGGGAGGFREYKSPVTPYTASPLDGNPCGTAITVSAQAYPITVGGGGSPGNGCCSATNGANSVFSTITSAGGGDGGENPGVGGNGGSGGGNGGGTPQTTATGNTPPVTPPQGNNGGQRSPSPDAAGGGGGGATAVGATASGSSGGNGGAGATTGISGSNVTRAGGGGAGAAPGRPVSAGSGGSGGGGGGNGDNGGTNTGGGAGGSQGTSTCGGTGGSGIVIIRYKFQ